MEAMKTVLMPLRVPDCDYCREPFAPFRLCEWFDNEGGQPTCGFNLGDLSYGAYGGVMKPKSCACLASANDTAKGKTGKWPLRTNEHRASVKHWSW
jgi:hypothetical protein